MQTHPETIYKVADKASVALADETGIFTGMPVDTADGFIHLSTAAQLPETLARHFAGQSDLVLFGVSTAALGDRLRWEVSRGGALFPHLYGSLPRELILWTERISVSADGSTTLPPSVR